MPRFVALLRAVNVGGRRPVPMADLRALAGGLGFREVATFIQSGNLVFTADGKEEAVRIEPAVERRFGSPVVVLVRTAAQWRRYLDANPFTEQADRVVLLLPRKKPPAGGVAALEARGAKGERVIAVADAAWAHFPAGIAPSKLTAPVIDRCLGSPTTARNLRTVEAIRDLL